MKLFESKHLIALLGVLALIVSGCASGSSKPQAQQTARQFDAPETVDAEPDKDLFSQALKAQNEGQFESAIQLWESFLSKHPESFEGHNNLGLVYYTQDMLSQSLREFETAYRLQRDDKIIRKNLARALRFKASMLHENREYFETLEILARLEQIVEPEEKQAILFKQEQVEDQIFLQVIKADNAASYQDFINRFPDGLNTVRAREYLGKNSNKKVSKKVTSNAKSWISSGKAGDAASWASAEQPPQYSSARPSAVYTPPAGGGGKKLGDFFGADPEGMKKAEEESANAAPAVDPAAAIPFEDFEKPERSSGDPAAAQESADGKESRRVAEEFNPIDDAPDTVTAGLDTLPDLTPVPVADLPAEMKTPQSEDTTAGAIEMQPVEQETEKAETAPTEETVEQSEWAETVPTEDMVESTDSEEVKQEEPEMAQAETAEPETVESESERIARIVQEEIANAESAPSEQAQPAPEPAQETDLESLQETPLEVASIDPEDQAVKQETAPDENVQVEETPSNPSTEETDISQETVSETVAALTPSPPSPAENVQVEETPSNPAPEETSISQETISETVAALMPSPPSPAEAMETPTDSRESPGSMVVIQMREGATLNVRAEPSTQGEIMGYLENGDRMPFMSESGDWYQIEIDEGLSGWISKKYSTLRDATEVASVSVPSASAPEEDLSSELTPLGTVPQQPADAMVIVTVSEEATLNVRSLPSASGAIVDILFQGDKLPLVKEEGEWYQVQFEDETTGWISKKFSIIEGTTVKASLPVPQETKKEPKAQRSNEMVTTVVVIKVPEGSSLNVRSAPSSKGQVMGSLKSGDMRPLLEEADEWYQVELQDGQSGWISRKFSGKMDVDSSFLQSP
jgi:uncharacterized protein YgiM (DUF1202 family)